MNYKLKISKTITIIVLTCRSLNNLLTKTQNKFFHSNFWPNLSIPKRLIARRYVHMLPIVKWLQDKKEFSHETCVIKYAQEDPTW